MDAAAELLEHLDVLVEVVRVEVGLRVDVWTRVDTTRVRGARGRR